MSILVESQVVAGVIVGAVLLVFGWLVRRVANSFSDDIKQTVASEVRRATEPILAQFSNNGGKTLKDGQDRLERGQLDQAEKIVAVKEMVQAQSKILGEHIAYHRGQESKTAPKKAVPRKVVAK